MVEAKVYNSKASPYIVKAFEASTGHITLTDNQCLQRDSISHSPDHNPVLIVYPYEFGYFIFVDIKKEEQPDWLACLEKEGYSEQFRNLAKLAQDNECKFLQLDQDGIEYEDIPNFGW